MDNKQPINLFYCYSHKDEDLRNELENHLKSLQKEGYINSWHDRKITAGNEWKEKIDENIEKSKVILLLISSDFIGSDYCYDIEMEKALAMHEECSAVVIPVILRECNWQISKFSKLQVIPTDGRAITGASWHDHDTAFTDAAKLIQKKIEELWRLDLSIEKLSPIQSKQKQIGFKNIPAVKPYFSGREDELKELKESYDTSPFILIEGGGGIGKTQLVAKFIADENLKAKTVWFICSTTSQTDDLIRSAGFEEILQGDYKTDLQKFSAFKDKVEEYSLSVFIDNYHNVEGKQNFISFLSFIDEYLSQGHIIIICRDNVAGIAHIHPRRIHLAGMGQHSLSHATRLIKHLYPDLRIQEKVLENICTNLQGYPLAIDLAINLLSQGIQPDKIIEVAVQQAKDGIATIEEMVARLLNEIFTREDTTTNEIDFLKLFSVFQGKVDELATRFIVADDLFYSAGQNLKHKNILNINDGIYELHPLIRELCYEKLQDREKINNKAGNYFKSLRVEKFNPDLEDKIFYHFAAAGNWSEINDTIINSSKDFIRRGYNDQIQQMITSVRNNGLSAEIFNILEGDYAVIKGDWQKAQSLFEIATGSTDELVAIEALIKKGELFFRRGNYNEAKNIFEVAERVSKDSKFEIWHARTLNDLGLIYWKTGYHDFGLDLLQKAFKIRLRHPNPIDISATRGNIAQLKKEKGQLKAALDLAEENIKYDEYNGYKWGIANDLNILGIIKNAMGRKTEAKNLYELAFTKFEEIGDKNGQARSLGNIGLIKGINGDTKEALNYYERSLNISLEIGDKDNTATMFQNIGSIYFDVKKDSEKACNYFIKSLILADEMPILKKQAVSSLEFIKQHVGINRFREIISNTRSLLTETEDMHLNRYDLIAERQTGKIKRNELCPCGNGKKYKSCHGKNI